MICNRDENSMRKWIKIFILTITTKLTQIVTKQAVETMNINIISNNNEKIFYL